MSFERKVSKLNKEMVLKAKLMKENHKKTLKLSLLGFGVAALVSGVAVLTCKKLHK